VVKKLGKVEKFYWLLTTHCTMPLIPFGLFIWDFVTNADKGYGGYPGWMQGIGWFLLSICLVLIPIGAALGYNKGGSTLDEMPGAILARGGDVQSALKVEAIGAKSENQAPAKESI